MTEPAEETAPEPEQCPKGHGAMRLRTRWAGQQAHPGRKGSKAEPITEWVCPRCGRTLPTE